jgi:hypothetical protein
MSCRPATASARSTALTKMCGAHLIEFAHSRAPTGDRSRMAALRFERFDRLKQCTLALHRALGLR